MALEGRGSLQRTMVCMFRSRYMKLEYQIKNNHIRFAPHSDCSVYSPSGLHFGSLLILILIAAYAQYSKFAVLHIYMFLAASLILVKYKCMNRKGTYYVLLQFANKLHRC